MNLLKIILEKIKNPNGWQILSGNRLYESRVKNNTESLRWLSNYNNYLIRKPKRRWRMIRFN